MGAYKYMNEIWRRKQSETMRYLQRVRLKYFYCGYTFWIFPQLICGLGSCLAIQKPERHPPGFSTNSSWKGTTIGIQGHSRFRRLQG